ncbi:hypothetical protein [Microbacterium sp. G2-8]|uniref:hypothetical protein n=1 Tax=Microbacterium sp. G2-8 TaxID=2842454 RepID=UPI001C891EA0|nr:hypothetical protein [Microbacterium sp. G2-8]
MLEFAMAGAGAVAAGSCCLSPARRRARLAAVVMALACLPIALLEWRLGTGLALLVASMALAIGARRREPRERLMDLHRALGGALMGAMVLLGDHAVTATSGAHVHGVPAHALLAVASSVYLLWTTSLLVRPAHRRTRAHRIELIAMAAMFAAMLLGMWVAG